jgi:hypothetical protein
MYTYKIGCNRKLLLPKEAGSVAEQARQVPLILDGKCNSRRADCGRIFTKGRNKNMALRNEVGSGAEQGNLARWKSNSSSNASSSTQKSGRRYLPRISTKIEVDKAKLKKIESQAGTNGYLW